MLIEPKLTNTSPNFGKPPDKQNKVNMCKVVDDEANINMIRII